MPRKRMPAADRRELILAAAGEAFGQRGYDGVRLDDVAAAAGVTKPMIYRHFGSKEDLYLALLERHRRDMPSFTAGLPELPFEQLVRAIFEAWFAYAEQHAYSWRMLFRDSGGSEAVLRSRAAMYVDARAVLAAFLEGHPAFELQAADVEPTAELLRGALSSLVLYGQEHPEVSRATLVENAARLLIGVAAQSRG